jgi:hypothetical protein
MPLMWENSTWQYLFDELTGQRIPNVDHVVQFEYLAQYFNVLAWQYGLDLRIPETRRENAFNYSEPDRFECRQHFHRNADNVELKMPPGF